MAKWDFVAMGEVGLTGWTGKAARPVARGTGRPEAESWPLSVRCSSRLSVRCSSRSH